MRHPMRLYLPNQQAARLTVLPRGRMVQLAVLSSASHRARVLSAEVLVHVALTPQRQAQSAQVMSQGPHAVPLPLTGAPQVRH